jgi:hypothetical protein
MTEDQINLQRTNTEWMMQQASCCTHAVTLTLKPYRVIESYRGRTRETVTESEAKSNFRLFMNRLNANLFGNASKRFGKSVTAIPVLGEIRSRKKPHYHCAMGNFRDHLDDEAIAASIKSAWRATPFGNYQVDVQPMTTDLWLGYLGNHTGNYDNGFVDVENLRLPPALLS